MTYNIRCGTIRWKISDFLFDDNSNACIFQHILVKIVEKFVLEKLGQCHEVKFSQ